MLTTESNAIFEPSSFGEQEQIVALPKSVATPLVGASEPLGGLAKRLFDIVVSAAALIALSPVFLVLTILVYRSSPGPVLFRHERIGYRGKTFLCTKFRTMRMDAEAHLHAHLAENPKDAAEFKVYQKLRKDPRIIPVVGDILRRTSLDELPQLFDVLLGRMSLVGPRPVTADEIALYAGSRGDYISARPGITGLWQVSGRNTISFEGRVKIDVSYVQNWRFGRDLLILLKTVKVVIKREGAC